VELAGKHVDYAGGCSLTCATSVHLTAQVEAIERAALQVSDARTQRQAKLTLSPTAGPSKERWSVYLAAVARRIARDFPAARTGASMRIDSTIPTSAGLSSSSALVISAAMALFDVNGLWESPVWREVGSDPLAFAEYCAAMESGAPWGPFAGDTGVGTRGGAQDHIAICTSRDGMVGVYGYLPGRIVRRESWPGAWRIVVANSGVKATKTGNARLAYNRAADSVRSLVAVWNAETGRADETLSAALESSPDAYTRLLSLSARAASDTLSEEYLRARLEDSSWRPPARCRSWPMP
jgi:galactokinase